MQKKDTVPVKTLSAIYLLLFIVLLILLPVYSVLDAFVIGFILALSFSAAITAAAFTQKASMPVLVCVGFIGLISLGIGIYFWINVPEGILSPLFILIGGGVSIAQILLIVNRYRQRGERKNSST